MSFWFSSPAVADAESILYRGAGNLFQSRRQVGVQVTVTDRRVLIIPNRLDSLLGGKRVELARDRIHAVHTEPANTSTARQRGLSARLRPQIEIRTAEASYVVTVTHAAELMQSLG